MDEVGMEIKRLREEKDWTGAQLAVYAGMSPSAISQIETGRRNPNMASLTKLAEALEVEVSDFFPKVQASLPLEHPEQRRASTEEEEHSGYSMGGSSQRHYLRGVVPVEGAFSFGETLGRVLASNWKDELEEWDKKIPTETSTSDFDIGRLFEWVVGVGSTKRTYEALAVEAYGSPSAELQDTLKLMDDAYGDHGRSVQSEPRLAARYRQSPQGRSWPYGPMWLHSWPAAQAWFRRRR